jgi:hypothetical protein
MGNSFQIKWIFIVIFSLSVQVFILRDVALANLAFCFIYLWIILKAPIHTPLLYLILGGFFMGWFVDIFYNTHGIHSLATVLIAFLRPFYFKVLTPVNGYDERSSVSLSEMKALWFFPYISMMLLSHHLILFLVESADASLLTYSLLRAFASAILGTLVFGILELFNQKK